MNPAIFHLLNAAFLALPQDAGSSPSAAGVDRDGEVPPNIVFLLADDMGYGDPGCYNPDSRTPTPHIDRLAREGLRFTDAHAPGSVCVPTRYGLLTGRYPFRARLDVRKRSVIEPGRMTIASLLRANGYHTAMVGKWHLGFDGPPRADEPLRGGPVDRGFDAYFGIPASLDIPPYYYIRDREPLALPSQQITASQSEGWSPIQGAFWRAGGVAPGFEHAEVLPRLGREAVEYIERRSRTTDGRPFFLYVAFTAPHTPWLPLEKYRGQSAAGLYGDFVVQVDATVGQILKALERCKLADRTLVFFTSDNGPVWYEKDEHRHGHRSRGPLRGMKGDAWEGGHRVPFIARWPGQVPAAAVCHETLCFTDMLATFAALVGEVLPPDAGEDSFDQLPALLGKELAAPIREVTIHKHSASTIRAGKWKLITHLGSGGFSRPRQRDPEPDGPRGQLYDLEEDPGETNNRWLQDPAVVKRLTDLLQQHREGRRSARLPTRK